MVRPACKKCLRSQAVRSGGLCNACFAKEMPVPKDIRTLNRVEIARDYRIQTRVQYDEDTICRYATAVKEWEEDGGDAVELFPPAVVFTTDDATFLLADGFHRDAALGRVNAHMIRVEVRRGDWRDALLYALGANSRHGLTTSDADKRKAVGIMLDDPEWSGWSNRGIAKACGVSHALVNRLVNERKAQAPDARPPEPDEEYETGEGECGSASTPDGDDGPPDEGLEPHPADLPPPQSTMERTREKPPKSAPVKKTASGEMEDARGNPIPTGLRDVFADGTLADAIARVEDLNDRLIPGTFLRSLAGKIKALPYVRLSDAQDALDAAHEALMQALAALTSGVPHSVCPKCGGKGEADCCRGAGYVPEWRYLELRGR